MRTFTLEEANRLLPTVKEGLAEVSDILERLRHARDQLMDLRIIWGDAIEEPTCKDHAEYVGFRDRFAGLETQLRRAMGRVTEIGCEVKDPDAGLVDFYADRGGKTVFLCWRRGETRIGFWHTLEDGFAGRRPITQF